VAGIVKQKEEYAVYRLTIIRKLAAINMHPFMSLSWQRWYFTWYFECFAFSV